jgi:Asp-tRNA(Asn)/Glu-tRNA(Gln) amidotransferase A subunit family amidase
MAQKPSRRSVVKRVVASGVAAVATGALAAPATTSTTEPSISIDDMAAADRVEARVFSDEDRKLMQGAMATYRERLKGLRNRKIPPTIEPAVHFDPRMLGTPVPSGSSSCSTSSIELPAYDGHIESLAFTTVLKLSHLLQAGKISSESLTRMCLDRLKRIGPRLNCVVNLMEESALAQARRADRELAQGKSRGPLHGIPWGAKDLLATKDVPTTWGAAPYRDQVFDYNATVVRKLDEAGAVLCAKLSLGELAMGDIWFAGKTRSPWKPSEGSSGSSAGPAAAVAAGLVPFAIGSETMGSIVSPCLVNAVTGLRPTYGRVSRYGAMPLSRTMDKLGPIARCVEDCAIVLSAIHGRDDLDPTAADVPFIWNATSDLKSLRVGYNPAAFEQIKQSKSDSKAKPSGSEVKLSEARKKVYADALEQIRKLAGDLKPITLPPTPPYTGIAGLTIAVESASSFTELVNSGKVRDLKQQDEGAWPTEFRVGATIPASDYLRAQQVRTMLQRDMAEVFKDIDLYVNIPYSGPTLAYTNLTGHPTLIARCGIVDDRPVMLEYVGALYREDAICRLALAYEQATDWTRKWPDTEKIPPLS